MFRIEKHSDEVLNLAEKAIERVRSRGLTATDRKSAALAEFLAELENNPFGMVDAVFEFSHAFFATVQQSVNREMQRRKGIGGPAGEEGLEYEYVIVDEAARVSPRDLMIPMSQGKRIILVGDHRQLPHIIDEEVARRMEQGEDVTDENEWLKKSMFQYLFSERLKALEDADRITRRVTLDKQFRMHPEASAVSSAATSTRPSTGARSSSRACPPARSPTTSPARATHRHYGYPSLVTEAQARGSGRADSPAGDRCRSAANCANGSGQRKAPRLVTASSRSTRPKPTESGAN